jgi:FkbH-like protein/non-ribosomal peptide synthase protein (TIGR01720 family)
MTDRETSAPSHEIAIVGMAGRFANSRDLQAFWEHLRAGTELITRFSDQELLEEGFGRELIDHPSYVRASSVLDEIDRFDAAFFGINPREAAIMDPQHRLFLECAWEALEQAGYDPERYDGAIGVFASSMMSTYLQFNLSTNRELVESVGALALRIANDRDFMPTRVSYKLNLKGPSFSVQTACSSSLVAVHLACQSLIDYQADMALAGGVSIMVPQKHGYIYQEGGIYSPDGHCRAFDARAGGTVSGSGMGLVVLKRLDDALEDGDTIYAVIKGSAINNDGSDKVGFTAPSVEGQIDVIATAQTVAQVEPDTIGYIEAHGTGTTMGDPVEIAALTQVFREQTSRRQFCAVGSVKTNIGHLDAAAGVAGLLKAALALHHREIPPSLHFEQPNPNIDFAGSPFFVNAALRPWPAGNSPRRAAVSSFAVGGTNAHLVLEEAPEPEPGDPARPWQLLPISARSQTALDQASLNLAAHLERYPEQDLADVAYTLKVGRRAFGERRVVVARDAAEAAAALRAPQSGRVFSASAPEAAPALALMFPGQGAQYVGMGRDLYEREPLFRQQVDRCCELLRPHLRLDLRQILYPAPAHAEAAARQLEQTALTQPALFVVEYALARLLAGWGLQPRALIGHSIGEYVAATLAGVFSLEDALGLVAARGRLMQSLPAGSMLSVAAPAEQIGPRLAGGLALAAVNGPALCVVAGPTEAIERLQAQLQAEQIECRRLHTSHAFHSAMVEPILPAFAERLARVRLSQPSTPFISNVSGTWITAAQATDPSYWVRHLRQAVQFGPGLAELLRGAGHVLLEVGPGRTLTSLARQQLGGQAAGLAITTMRHPQEQGDDLAFLLTGLGRVWLNGLAVDWDAFYGDERRLRVPLPTYPFERKRFWIAPPREQAERPRRAEGWLYAPLWEQTAPPATPAIPRRWLVFGEETGPAAQLCARLRQRGLLADLVRPGAAFARAGEGYTIDPRQPGHYAALLETCRAEGGLPERVVHAWSLDGTAADEPAGPAAQSLGLLAQALAGLPAAETPRLVVLTDQALEVLGSEPARVGQALAHTLAREAGAQTIDIAPPAGAARLARLADLLIAEMAGPAAPAPVAYRGLRRWTRRSEALPPADPDLPEAPGGVYVLSDGASEAGLALGALLAGPRQARLAALVGPGQPAPAPGAAPAELIPLGGGEAQHLRAALAEAERHYGPIRALIHGAADLGLPARPLDTARLQAEGRALERLAQAADGLALEAVLLLAPLGAGHAAASQTLRQTFARGQTGAAPWVAAAWDTRLLGAPALAGEAGAALLRQVLTHGQSAALLVAAEHPDAPPAPPEATETDAAHERPAVASAYAAPASPTEQALAALWQNLLGLASVGVHDDFFELGGHSLLATRLVTRAQEQFQASLTLQEFFERPTVAGMAALLDERRGGAELPAPIPTAPRDGPLPLSFAQQRLWALAQLEGASPRHNIPLASRFRGDLQLDALELALNELVRRHEVLRTAFVAGDSGAVLQILPEQPAERRAFVRLALADLSQQPPAEREPAARRFIAAEAARPFDLTQAPLLRASVLRLDQRECVLLISLHHIVFDGWSWGVFARELAGLYGQYSAGRDAGLPALALQYADYTVWQQERMAGAEFEQHLAYWRERLAGAPALLELPTDRPRQAAQSLESARHTLSLPAILVEHLRAAGQREGASLYMVLLAAFVALLHRYSDQDDIVLGSPSANRPRPELEPLIGPFADILVLRHDLSGDPTFRELLGRMRECVTGAFAHQEVPFAQIVELVRPPRAAGHHPVFQVMFNLMAAQEQRLELPGLELVQMPAESGATDFDLFLTAVPVEEGLHVVLDYSTALFDSATVERLASHYQALLESAAAQPEQRLAELLAPIPRPKTTVAVSATFTAEPVADGLAFWTEQLGLPATLRFAPYNQVFQELLNPASLTGANAGGVNLLLLRLEDWAGPAAAPDQAALERAADDLVAALGAAVQRTPATYLVLLCPPAPAPAGLPPATDARLRARIAAGLEPLSGVYVRDMAGDPARYQVFDYHDPVAHEAGHMPFTPAGYALLATAAARMLFTLRRPPLKVIALDCDNTLWGGVCGEDGPLGVRLDPAYLAFQRFLVEQRAAGVLLCLCSKNNEADVLEVFRQRPEMPLKLEHITARRINWAPKSENLRALAAELSLSLDSFLFLDDSPLECAEVRDRSPEVLALALPEPEAIPAFLEHLWVFDHLKVTDEDRRRSEMYAQNRLREQARAEATSLEAFLAGLDLAVEVAPAQPQHLARVADLTQRTNQFNLTTLRRDESEIAGLLAGGERECLVVHVRDRFGDYGLVGVLLFAAEGPSLAVDTFLLSCRVLGRRVEDTLLLHLARLAAERGLAELRLPYLRSAKNAPALEFLQRVAPGAGQPQAGGLIFRFAVDELLRAGLPSGDAAPAAAPAAADLKPAPGADPSAARRREALMARISGQLRSGAQIQAAIEQARPRPQAEAARAYVAPRTPAEQTLAQIWAQVLRVERVGINDNFFQLGGDSILGVQVIAQANRAGLRLAPKDLFEHRTVAELALVAAPSAGQRGGPPSGPAPLTPAQRRLLALPEPELRDQSYVLRYGLGGPADQPALERALAGLLMRHDALRLRFEQTPEEGWSQRYADPAEPPALRRIDLGSLAPPEREAAIEAAVAELRAALLPGQAPLFRAVLIDQGPDQPAQLLLGAHLLVADRDSWPLIGADLGALYAGADLAPAGVSFQRWAEQVAAYSGSGAPAGEAGLWLADEHTRAHALPADPGADPSAGGAQTVALRLDPALTRALLEDVPPVYHTRTAEVLLAALAVAWAGWTGAPALRVELEGSARAALGEEHDATRTAGPCATAFPLLIDLRGIAQPGEQLKAAKEQIRRVPRQGLAYQAALERGETAERLRAAPAPEVAFRLLEPLAPAQAGPLVPLGWAGPAPVADPRRRLEISADVTGDQLSIVCSYWSERDSRARVEQLAAAYEQALRALVEHCRSPEAGGYTPSDFPDEDLSSDDLDAIFAQLNQE